MQCVTFSNEQNGLSVSFSTDNPAMFLESFNGSSCGASETVYKPAGLDGQRLISTKLNSRTIEMTVSFNGASEGAAQYTKESAMQRWDEIQRVLVPGDVGVLTWTDGTQSRFIRCRCKETPRFERVLPFLFKASFMLVADMPLWYDTAENTVSLSSGTVVNNTCGIAVPFRLKVSAATDVFSFVCKESGAGIALVNNLGEGFTIDTGECTVTTDSGELANASLSFNSEFFKLIPGSNTFVVAGANGVTLSWNNAYMAIG